LREWNIYAIPKRKSTLNNIFEVGMVVDMIEEILGEKIIFTSFFRPKQYNIFIGGSKRSAHMYGKALDFKGTTLSADQIRAKLKPYLVEMGIRMENLPGSDWVHVDINKVINKRFFKP